MRLNKITEQGLEPTEQYGYTHKLDTKTGTVYISLRGKHLCCNFVGSEKQAQIKFGHWKVNTMVESQSEIINHLNYLKK